MKIGLHTIPQHLPFNSSVFKKSILFFPNDRSIMKEISSLRNSRSEMRVNLSVSVCLAEFVPLRLSGIELKSASSYAGVRFCITTLNIFVMWMKCKFNVMRFVVSKGETVS